MTQRKVDMKIIAKLIILVIAFLAGFYYGQQKLIIPETNIEPSTTGEEFETIDESKSTTNIMIDWQDGEIKSFTNQKITASTSVFSLLEQVTQQEDINLEYKDYGKEMGVMVEAIGGAYNDFTEDQWWQFWVNNEYAQVGASNHLLQNGDTVEWKYVKGQVE